MITKKKIPYIIIFLGLFYSISISLVNTIKFDRFFINSGGSEEHRIIRTDVKQYWQSAHEFKSDLEKGKGFF